MLQYFAERPPPSHPGSVPLVAHGPRSSADTVPEPSITSYTSGTQVVTVRMVPRRLRMQGGSADSATGPRARG
jgi:hypothetical protein